MISPLSTAFTAAVAVAHPAVVAAENGRNRCCEARITGCTETIRKAHKSKTPADRICGLPGFVRIGVLREHKLNITDGKAAVNVHIRWPPTDVHTKRLTGTFIYGVITKTTQADGRRSPAAYERTVLCYTVCSFVFGGHHNLYLALPLAHAAHIYLLLCRGR